MKVLKRYGGLLMIALILSRCIEPYDPELNNDDANLLVVDGYLDGRSGNIDISLSRSLPVMSDQRFPAESQAFVRVEDSEQNIFPLTESAPGLYTGTIPSVNMDNTYRLLITTNKNHQYASDFAQIINTPEIDSLTWTASRDGVEFAVTTHDPRNQAKHYRWTYEETYEYNTTFTSFYRFEGTEIVPRAPDDFVRTCWRTVKSTNIIVGSARLLNEAVISKLPVALVPLQSAKIGVAYSLLVKQQALTEDAYDYWSMLERSTENLGGLFDPLPSQVNGNVHSITNAGETVLGFFSAGTVTESRIFLERTDLPRELMPRPPFDQGCRLDTVLLRDLPNLHQQTVIIDGVSANGIGLIGYSYTATASCGDCTRSGGTTIKPTFWE